MPRNSSLTKVGVTFTLLVAACGGDKGPDPCPDVPPCITGSTWNASVCACIQQDEIGDAAGDGRAERGARGDGGPEGSVGKESDGEDAAADGASD